MWNSVKIWLKERELPPPEPPSPHLLLRPWSLNLDSTVSEAGGTGSHELTTQSDERLEAIFILKVAYFL